MHGDGDPRTGTPLCLDCYDHAAQVAWNAFVPKLWTRTIDAVKRELRRLSRAHGGTPARLRYAKVAEFQARGAVHLHALIRLDGSDPADPDAVLAAAELGHRRAAQPAPGRRRPHDRDPHAAASRPARTAG